MDKSKIYIVGKTQHDFGGSIPSGGNILCHKPLITGCFLICARGATSGSGRISTRQAKVANFQLAVRIHEKITWWRMGTKSMQTER